MACTRAKYASVHKTKGSNYLHSIVLLLLLVFILIFVSACKPTIKITVTPNPPDVGKAPVTVTFDASGTTDIDCKDLMYEWDFGDGNKESDINLKKVDHEYTGGGTFSVKLKVSDCKSNPNVSEEEVTVKVDEPDNPVLIKLAVDHITGLKPLTVTFDAKGTLQNGATDLNYKWDFNSDGVIDAEGNNLDVISYTYEEAKTYIATLKVTGINNSFSTKTVSIEVKELGPVNIMLSVNPLSGEAPLRVDFDATGTWQQDSSELIYEWDFDDDGEVDTSGIDLKKVSHTYGIAKTYTAKLKVKNTKFFSSSNETTVPINVSSTSSPFVGEYADLIPKDSEAAYDAKRFSVIRGKVEDRYGSGIKDITVTVHKLNELEGHYGSAKTDVTGYFNLPVNGGGIITLQYEDKKYLTVQRQVNISWGDVREVEPVVMINRDGVETLVEFDGNPKTVITHKATVQSDSDGSRGLTMVFKGDTNAYELDENGNRGNEIEGPITVRATEYTVGDTGPHAMPAVLPPASAYTYCVELAVDNHQRVEFSKPVVSYVDNFLDFPVGAIVPVGYYNRDKGVWIPEKNGVVVKLLHINKIGTPSNVVNALDINGDNQPDDIDALGLEDTDRFHVGDTYWRFETAHFTPFDLNWPGAAPEDATAPNPYGSPVIDEQVQDQDDCNRTTNSYVNERSRIFHEDIPIPGTGLTLHYASNKTKGYLENIGSTGHKYSIEIPLSGSTIPSSLKKILLRIDIAGRTFSYTFLPGKNKSYVFNWNGLDFRRNPATGIVQAKINIGFEYPVVYEQASNYGSKAFSMVGGNIVFGAGRDTFTSWASYDVYISVLATQMKTTAMLGGMPTPICEGWSLSNLHYIDPRNLTVLYKGNGSIVKLKQRMERIAGLGGSVTGGYNGDNIPAKEAKIQGGDIALDSRGNLYIADRDNHKIRKVDSKGIITTIAGGGSIDPDNQIVDGKLGTDIALEYPSKIVSDNMGNVYF